MPNLWFGDADEHESPGQRFHIEVYVAPEVAAQRIAAAVAAGGTIVDDGDAPSRCDDVQEQGNRLRRRVRCDEGLNRQLGWPEARPRVTRPAGSNTVNGMATESSYTIAPLSPETWSAFDALVQRHNGIFGGCWCIWFHPDGPERGQGAEANRAGRRPTSSRARRTPRW